MCHHVLFPFCCRVVCMSCGTTTCRHSFQEQLVGLNPAAAEQLGAARGISSQAARQRALAAGTAADARKVAAGQQAEQVGGWGAGAAAAAGVTADYVLKACCGSWIA
jgi:hypothetical protein